VVRVLHEDDALLAVDKPAGALCVRGRAGAAEPSLVDELAASRGEKLFIVHRLDRGTSGVLLVARTAAAHRALNLAFERSEIEKTYLALVRGAPKQEFSVDVALMDARRGRSRVAAAGETGKPARTDFKVVERFGDSFALLEARPKTGRTHQIRVHLRHAGFPLAVDSQYARVDALLRGELGLTPAEEVVLARTPLHASALRLAHPATGAELVVWAPMPPDLAAALDLLRTVARHRVE